MHARGVARAAQAACSRSSNIKNIQEACHHCDCAVQALRTDAGRPLRITMAQFAALPGTSWCTLSRTRVLKILFKNK
jgi:hypothetical protein